MTIKSIQLINFRNHAKYNLDCKNETTLILGENGSGKTSVLEAIYITTRGKSFRATDLEILKRGAEYYRIELEYQTGEKTVVTFNGKEKQFNIADKKHKRLPKNQKKPIVLFLPSDLNLISHSPGRRRDYFDNFFGSINDEYANTVSKYKKTLKQRNELLKRDKVSKEELFSWNILLARLGTTITKSRQESIHQINDGFPGVYHSIAKNDDSVKIEYQSEVKGFTETNYLNTLEKNYQKDVYLGCTTFGVHHDDYIFYFNNNPSNGSASRGETRSIILALKFIEAKLTEQATRQKPIILLDDVFSELDNNRRACLVENFKENQVIITSVESINKE